MKTNIFIAVLFLLVLGGLITMTALGSKAIKERDEARQLVIGFAQVLEVVSDTSTARFKRGESNAVLSVHLLDQDPKKIEIQWSNIGKEVIILQVSTKGKVSKIDWYDGLNPKPVILKTKTPWDNFLN